MRLRESCYGEWTRMMTDGNCWLKTRRSNKMLKECGVGWGTLLRLVSWLGYNACLLLIPIQSYKPYRVLELLQDSVPSFVLYFFFKIINKTHLTIGLCNCSLYRLFNFGKCTSSKSIQLECPKGQLLMLNFLC